VLEQLQKLMLCYFSVWCNIIDLTYVLPVRIADKEEIDIRYYSIIYAAIDDLKDAMEGMLAPEMKEEVLGTAEIREI
jgi:hypothetical protein